MKNDIVFIYDTEARAGTYLIAKGFDRQHKHVLELIDRYKKDFEEFGRLKRLKTRTKGRPITEYLINQQQAMLLGTYMRNNEPARRFKINLIKKFEEVINRLRIAESQRKDPERLEVREAGKLVRADVTHQMKLFTEYAKAQGSTNYERYYVCITKMMNAMLFMVEGHYKNLRDVMTIKQLMTVSSAEQIIDNGLRDGMVKKMYYKDIFQEVKRRVMMFADLYGKTSVIEKCLTEEKTSQIPSGKINA